MIELSRLNIRNAVILGMLFGLGVCISSQIVNELIWQVKYPNGWVERNKVAGN